MTCVYLGYVVYMTCTRGKRAKGDPEGHHDNTNMKYIIQHQVEPDCCCCICSSSSSNSSCFKQSANNCSWSSQSFAASSIQDSCSHRLYSRFFSWSSYLASCSLCFSSCLLCLSQKPWSNCSVDWTILSVNLSAGDLHWGLNNDQQATLDDKPGDSPADVNCVDTDLAAMGPWQQCPQPVDELVE